MSLAAPGTNPASNLELKLPHTIGSANQLLKVDGSGQLGWADDNSGLSLSNDANNRIVTGTGSGLNAEANLTFDGTSLTVTNADIITLGGNLKLKTDAKYVWTGADEDSYYGHTGASMQLVNQTGWMFIGNSGASNDAPIYIRTHHSYNQITCFSTSHASRPGEVALCAGATGAERLSTTSYGIHIEGNVRVPNGNGIEFSAYATSGNPSSNLLDDYERGTFTPRLRAHNSVTGQVTGYGTYIKVGKIVHYQFGFNNVDCSSIPTGAQIKVDDLPFVFDSPNNFNTTTNPMSEKIVTRTNNTFYSVDNDNHILGIYANSNAGWSGWSTDDFNHTAVYLHFNMSGIVD
mgnify:CR=1 FL=1